MIKSSAVPRNFPEEHVFWANPIGLVSIKSLINHHALLCLGVEGRRTSVPGQPGTGPKTGLQNEPKRLGK